MCQILAEEKASGEKDTFDYQVTYLFRSVVAEAFGTAENPSVVATTRAMVVRANLVICILYIVICRLLRKWGM